MAGLVADTGISWARITEHTVPQLSAIARAVRRKDARTLADAVIAASAPHGKAAAEQVRKTISARTETPKLRP